MLPKNQIREEILSQKLIVHHGPYHTQYAQMLPQFCESEPLDINSYFNLQSVGDKEKFEIEFESDPSKRPVELANLDVVSKEEDTIPLPLRPKSKFTDPKENLFRSQFFKS